MSKYALLIIINLPLILTGIISAITDYKASRIISRHKCWLLVLFWLSVGVALVLAEPIYNALIRANLTDSPPMSLFDVLVLTVVVFLLFCIVKMNERIQELNRKLSRIHERIAILGGEENDSRR